MNQNESLNLSGDETHCVEQCVEIEQGPEFMVDLFVGGPAWMQLLILAIGGVVVGLSALSVHRNGMQPEVLEEIGQIGIIVFSIWGSTKVIVETGQFDYFVDVILGTTIGFITAKGFIIAVDQFVK